MIVIGKFINDVLPLRSHIEYFKLLGKCKVADTKRIFNHRGGVVFYVLKIYIYKTNYNLLFTNSFFERVVSGFTLNLDIFMKCINKLVMLAILLIVGMTSCQKEQISEVELFNIEDYTGRYVFDIELQTMRDGELKREYFNSVGYVTKESNYSIKILFDYAAPKVNCVYEYAVRPDGSFFSLYRGAGDRTGEFENDFVSFDETINLGNGNFKNIAFTGKTNKN